MARNERYSKVVCFLICFLTLMVIVGVVLYKPPLRNATTSDLDSIYGIKTGGVIMERIQEFIIEHPNAKVEDLRSIKGVDDMIIKQLEKRFR